MRFKRKRPDRVTADVDRLEAALLTTLASDLLTLLGGDDDAEQDPLVALVGFTDGDVRTPDDPALARLLPDAYADDDAAAAEFRRFTEQDLRGGKRANAGAVIASLAPYLDDGGRLVLDRDEVDAWLGTLNDLRLVLAVRLDVTEETDLDPPGDDPHAQALQVYGWLGWLQESLLSCIVPRAAGR